MSLDKREVLEPTKILRVREEWLPVCGQLIHQSCQPAQPRKQRGTLTAWRLPWSLVRGARDGVGVEIWETWGHLRSLFNPSQISSRI